MPFDTSFCITRQNIQNYLKGKILFMENLPTIDQAEGKYGGTLNFSQGGTKDKMPLIGKGLFL